MEILKKLNWSLLGKMAAIVTVLGGIISMINWGVKESSEYNISATIQQIDYNLPHVINNKIVKKYNFELFKEIHQMLKESNDSIESSVDILFNNEKNVFFELERNIIKKINKEYYRNTEKLENILVPNYSDEDSISSFRFWNLAIIKLINEGNNEIEGLMIEIKKVDSDGGYFEIVSNGKIIKSSYFKNKFELPKLRSENELTVRVWCNILSAKDDRISITHPNGKVRPKWIITTQGFYAWTTTHLNSFLDFWFFVISPLLFFIWVLISFNQKRSNKTS